MYGERFVSPTIAAHRGAVLRTAATIKLNPSNPRQHSQTITKIARNIDKVGFIVPCLVDDDNRVLAGNARIAAAAQLGMAMVPVVRLRHLSEPEKRAFIIADNRLPELASWNEESLRQELAFLSDLDIDFDWTISRRTGSLRST